MEMLKKLLRSLGKGLKDSIYGTFKIYNLDKDLDREREEASRQAALEPMSTLARRRAERFKQRKAKDHTEPKVLQRIILCCAWNGGLFWLSIFLFNSLLIPLLEYLSHFMFGGSDTHSLVWSWMSPMLSWTFGVLWVLPLFVLSKIINSLWFQDIADAAYRLSRGRPAMFPSLSKFIADILFSLLIQALFLIQGMSMSLVPFMYPLGPLVSVVHMTLLYSLYAFEYKWINMGWEVHKRLSYMETNWPYFVGFGLPMAVFTALPSSNIISGCVFSLLFPLFIISANEAEPIKQTYDHPLRIFSFVVSMSNAVFQHSVKKSHSTTGEPTPSGSPTPSSGSSQSGSSLRGSPPRGASPQSASYSAKPIRQPVTSAYGYPMTTKAKATPKVQTAQHRSSKSHAAKAAKHESDYY